MSTKIEITNVITQDHPIAPYVIILDENDEPISFVRSYNIDTKEAEIYRTEPSGKIGKVVIDENGKVIFDKVVLNRSKLRFKAVKDTHVPIFKTIKED